MIRFKDKTLQAYYEHLMKRPPVYPNSTRRLGSAFFTTFWFGYDGLPLSRAAVPQTFGHACWRAGTDYRAEHGDVFPKGGQK